MNKKFVAGCFAAVLALGLNAQDAPTPENAPQPCPPQMKTTAGRPRIAQCGKTAETVQRRREIMILVEAYKILPEEQRGAVKDEIVKRLRADFEAHQAMAQKMTAEMEKKLEAMKKHLSEADADAMVEKEFERLLNAGICPAEACAPVPACPPPKNAQCAPSPMGGKANCPFAAGKSGKISRGKAPHAECCKPDAKCYAPKAECCKPHAECCKPGAKCCAPKAECCKPDAKCCAPKAECCKPDAKCCAPKAECCKPGAKCCAPKAECCKPKAECCKPGAKCCAPKAECCAPEAECCKPADAGQPEADCCAAPAPEASEAPAQAPQD